MRAEWIAVDWGTSSLRAWAMGPGDSVLAEAGSARGMGTLAPGAFEAALLDLIEPWLGAGGAPVPVIACGMVGARQGWQEAPYRKVPCAPLGGGALQITPADPRFALAVIPGLSQAAPPDVMRGEETQIAGILAARPGFDGVLCLPGTHTKWARVSAGEVVSFETAMTGELFALIAGQSVLRHSVALEGDDPGAFAAAVTDAMTAPQRLAARLFAVRAGTLLDGLPPATARARLSGLLIGMELAGARPYWLGQEVVIVGAGGPSRAYRAALAVAGCEALLADATATTLAGLAAARRLEAEAGGMIR